MKVRGSRADMAIACAGSLVPTDAPYEPQSDDATDGRAKHEALAYVAHGEEPPADEIAERYQVDADEIAKAVRYGKLAWSELAKWFPEAATEVKLEGEVTRGTCDVLSCGPDWLAFLDWKTGWSGDPHQYQLMAYADAGRCAYGMPTSGYVTAVEVWIRLREYNTRNFTEAELDGFRARMSDQIRSAQSKHPQYAAGPHCKFCPHQHHCAPRDEYLRSAVSMLAPTHEQPMALTREVIGQLYERRRAIERAVTAYDKLLDEELRQGPVPLGDGRELRLKEVEQDKLDGAMTARLLAGEFGFSELELSGVLSASKGSIERAVKARVPKGKAAEEMRRVIRRLRDAGAINKAVQHRKEIIDV